MTWLGWLTVHGLFLLGGFISARNYYLRYLRLRIHCWRGGTPENCQWVSSIRLIGSLFLISPLVYSPYLTVRVLSVVLIVLDTGGLHWLIFDLLRRAVMNSPANRAARRARG